MIEDNRQKREATIILTAQTISVSFIWVLAICITIWQVQLYRLARQLNDVPGFSLVISMIAIPIFWMMAIVLTYVFTGFMKYSKSD